MAGYADPGFWGVVGFALVAVVVATAGTGVGASSRGVAEGVTEFEAPKLSADTGRGGSCRRLAWRG